MGIRFSKSVRLGKFMKLNLSGSGVSATVGRKGASVTIGQRGTFLNLSPSVIGLNGTGLSYRQKISGSGTKIPQSGAALPAGTAGSGSREGLVKKPKMTGNSKSMAELTAGNSENRESVSGGRYEAKTVRPVRAVLEEYEIALETRLHLHRYAERVMTAEEFEASYAASENEAQKELYKLSAAGDEDTVESFVGSFMNHVELPYDVRVNYELEGDILYADLDLPEIEDFSPEYPAVSKDGKLCFRKKTASEQKEEYAETVMSLGVFLSAGFFNLSPAVKTIVLSGFTTVRNRDGDLTDEYLYSVKFTRTLFEDTAFFDLDDLYAFFLQFENRIRLSEKKTFKAVKPYERESAVLSAGMAEEAALALTELGYRKEDVRRILPELKEKDLPSVSDYLREGLKLLAQ